MIYFNSLSITSAQAFITNQDSLKQSLDFLNLMEGKFLLCVPFNSPDFIIKNTISLKQAIGNIVDIELKSLLVTILADSTKYLGEYPDGYLHQGKNEYFKAFNSYLSMNNQDCIILSLHSEPCWLDNTIPLINNVVTGSYLNCPKANFSSFQHGISVWENLIKKIIANKKKQDGLLCHADSLKKIIPTEIYNSYLNEIKNPQLRISNIRLMARLIAECCEYEFMQDISNRNKSASAIRDIYYNLNNEKYISTDVNHGRFEVLDNRGVHICEIDFEGTLTKPKDTTGRHDIRV